MNHYCEQWIADWCEENGWTDWFRERSKYWAFPPNAVMPVPIPLPVLRTIKAEKGLSPDERNWCLVILVSAGLALVVGYLIASPVPLVGAFAMAAIVVAQLEDDDLYPRDLADAEAHSTRWCPPGQFCG
jgi:nitric oxide synthase oxygenase domain/subunit